MATEFSVEAVKAFQEYIDYFISETKRLQNVLKGKDFDFRELDNELNFFNRDIGKSDRFKRLLESANDILTPQSIIAVKNSIDFLLGITRAVKVSKQDRAKFYKNGIDFHISMEKRLNYLKTLLDYTKQVPQDAVR